MSDTEDLSTVLWHANYLLHEFLTLNEKLRDTQRELIALTNRWKLAVSFDPPMVTANGGEP